MKRSREDGSGGGVGGGGGAASSASAAGPRGDRDTVAGDSVLVLGKVRALVASMRAEAAASRGPRTLADLGITGVREVAELSADEVLDSIEEHLCSVAASVMGGEGFSFAVPSRAASNQEYIKELDRIVLRTKVGSRPFASVASVRKATVMARVLQLLFDVVRKGIHVTKRDLFYTDVKLFVKQDDTDTMLDDVAVTLGCTRTSLHVVASEKGVVVGRVQFREQGDLIDW